ncbi:MAG TPA: ABC transporter substrate-binding protein [Chloroflexota bacterium]|nr:ABC transporter substrate-binding protein [Chloroflexota bacterium]
MPYRWLVVAAVGLLAGSACAAPAPPPGGSSAAPGAPPPAAAAPAASPAAVAHLPIVFSTSSAANSPIQLGLDEGIFQANGLEIELTHAPGNAGPAALLAGQAPIMVGGCAETIAGVAGGADFVIWLQPTNRMQYMLAGGPNAPDAASLPGKRLAVSRIGSSSHLSTKFILKHLGLDPDHDVVYVQVGNTPDRVAALQTGSVDATILSMDEGTLLGNQPGMRIIVDMTREAVPYCAQGVVATRQYVRDNPDVIRRFTRAFVEMTARYKRNREEGMAAVSHHLDEHDPQKVASIYESWVSLFVDKPYPDPQGVQFVLDEYAQSDPRARDFKVENLIDRSWVQELDEQGYLDQLSGAGPG